MRLNCRIWQPPTCGHQNVLAHFLHVIWSRMPDIFYVTWNKEKAIIYGWDDAINGSLECFVFCFPGRASNIDWLLWNPPVVVLMKLSFKVVMVAPPSGTELRVLLGPLALTRSLEAEKWWGNRRICGNKHFWAYLPNACSLSSQLGTALSYDATWNCTQLTAKTVGISERNSQSVSEQFWCLHCEVITMLCDVL